MQSLMNPCYMVVYVRIMTGHQLKGLEQGLPVDIQENKSHFAKMCIVGC